MYCKNCGSPNSSDASFCAKCGTPISERVAVGATSSTREPVEYRPAQAGILGRAWRDVTGALGWWKKVIFLCLLSCIPIVNFAIDGYSLRWGRELSFEKNNPLPKTVFKKKEILTGFRALLLNIVFNSVYYVVSFIVVAFLTGLASALNSNFGALIGVLLTVVVVLGYVFVYLPFINASTMRMTIVDYLESGFNVKQTWNAFRRGAGGAIAASIVPSLISAFVQFLLWLIFFAVVGAIARNTGNYYIDMINNYGYGSYLYDPTNILYSAYSVAFNSGSFIMAIMVVVLVICGMVSMFAKMITWRALGYWAAEMGPEWVRESDEEEAAEWAEKRKRISGREDSGKKSTDTPRAVYREESIDRPASRTPFVAAPAPEPKPVEKPSFRTMTSAPDLPDDKTMVSYNPPANGIVLIRTSNGAAYRIPSFPALIGKGSAADVVIDMASSISRVHARLAYVEGTLTIEDLGSTNGTKVNGAAIAAGSPVAIGEGDVIMLSDESFRVVML